MVQKALYIERIGLGTPKIPQKPPKTQVPQKSPNPTPRSKNPNPWLKNPRTSSKIPTLPQKFQDPAQKSQPHLKNFKTQPKIPKPHPKIQKVPPTLQKMIPGPQIPKNSSKTPNFKISQKWSKIAKNSPFSRTQKSHNFRPFFVLCPLPAILIDPFFDENMSLI